MNTLIMIIGIFGLGGSELVIIGIIILLLFGGKKIEDTIILNDKCFIANNTSKLKTFIDAIDSSGYSSKRPPPTKFRLDFKPELDSGPYQRY